MAGLVWSGVQRGRRHDDFHPPQREQAGREVGVLCQTIPRNQDTGLGINVGLSLNSSTLCDLSHFSSLSHFVVCKMGTVTHLAILL